LPSVDPDPNGMRLIRSILIGVVAAGCVAAVTAPAAAPAKTAGACGSSGYAYAGLAASRRSFGISATLVPVTAPQVVNGHVAAWVGVGGVGAGPGRTDEWLQVGFSGFPGSSSLNLYYEVALPNQRPRYYELESDLAPGTPRKVAVLEVRGRPDSWRVVVDGKAVSAPIRLPGSHGAWSPTATAESWGGGTFVCNRFWFRFTKLSVASTRAEQWNRIGAAYPFSDHGYRVIRQSLSSFAAGA
jgi:hypothetical protein